MDLEQSIQSRSRAADTYLFRQRLALIFIFAFTLGVFVSSHIFIQPLVCVLMFLVAGAIFLGEKIWYKEVRKESVLLALVLISFSLGSLRYSVKDFHTLDPGLEASVGEKAGLMGEVVSEPELRESYTRFILLSESNKILVSTDLYSPVQYGDRVRVEGKLEKPGIIDPSTSSGQGNGRPFDYAKYLSKDDIYYTMSFAEAQVLSGGHGNPVRHVLFKIKKSFVSKAQEILSEPHSSLLAGLVVSGRDAMPKDILEEFRLAGVVHIVVLSGYNITIIADFLRKFFEALFIKLRSKIGPHQALGPRTAAGTSILGIVLFVLMTGAEATVVRASLMVLAVIAAKLVGRNYSAPRALLLAAFVMVIENPKILVFDPSFQLSFLATSALIYVVPLVEKWMSRVPDAWGARSVAATTIGTQLAVLPLLVYSVGDISLVSLPANILILLIIPATMLVGFLAVMVGLVSSTLAVPLTFVAYLLLTWILGVSHFFGTLSFASINVPMFSAWVLTLAYLVLILSVVRLRNSSHTTAS